MLHLLGRIDAAELLGKRLAQSQAFGALRELAGGALGPDAIRFAVRQLHVLAIERDRVRRLQLRYLDAQGRWLDAWPRRDDKPEALPQAVEFRLDIDGVGEISRLIELPSSSPGGPR